MSDAGATVGSKLKVFISYSRNDLDFADQLVAVLEWQGFLPVIDRKGIYGAERWEERLGQLILEADIVVFILSPDSAGSDVCAWEVDEAARRAKRIIPVLCRPLDSRQPHERLRDLNYIHFYSEKNVPGSGFGTGQLKLIDALSIDVAWLREHTRLEELATRWEASVRPTDQLLRGSELSAYKAWRDRRPANAPDLTALQRAFLAGSEQEEAGRASTERKRLDEIAKFQAEREEALTKAEIAQREKAIASSRLVRRTMLGMVVALALALAAAGAGVFAWHNQRVAEDQRHRAETNLAAITDALAVLDNESDPKQVAKNFFNLAHNYLSQDRFDEAITLYKRSLAIAEKQFGLDSIEVASARTQMGIVYTKLKRYPEAEPLLNEALLYHERNKLSEHPNVQAILALLTEIYRVQGRNAEAEDIGRKAQQIALANATDIVPVFFATDRVRVSNPGRTSYGFDRSHRLELGKALVTVPKLHQVSVIERPWALKIPYLKVGLYEEAEDPKKHFTILELKTLTKEAWASATNERVAGATHFKGQALVFIHGWSTNFESAVFRAADLAYNLNFDGVPFVYSWPSSDQSPTSYLYDRETAPLSEPYLKTFVQLVMEKSGATKVSIVAHSMGNVPLMRALAQLRESSPPELKIDQLILVAPDIDRGVFEQLAEQVRGLARGVTLYCSSNDRLLQTSRRINGGVPRAGDVPEGGPPIIEGIDTIDVTFMSMESLGLGHAAYFEQNALLSDIGLLILTGERPPDKRIPILERVDTQKGTYWRYPSR